jgi:hypothetical protein
MLGLRFLMVGVIATPGWEHLTEGEVDIVFSQANSLYCSSAMEFGKSGCDRIISITKIDRNNLLLPDLKQVYFQILPSQKLRCIALD